jgi:hypothetical protein
MADLEAFTRCCWCPACGWWDDHPYTFGAGGKGLMGRRCIRCDYLWDQLPRTHPDFHAKYIELRGKQIRAFRGKSWFHDLLWRLGWRRV